MGENALDDGRVEDDTDDPHPGLVGDPMVTLEHGAGGLVWLLDLGEQPQLPVRWVHRTTEVLLSHTHMDHFAGIVWFLRRRVGVTDPVRLTGPEGTAASLAGAVEAFTWDRIGDLGPCFEVVEIRGGGAPPRCFRLRVGHDATPRPIECSAAALGERNGVVVRPLVLDHGGLPVVAYRIGEPPFWSVRSDQLAASALPAGPWIGRLKRLAASGDDGARLALPEGSSATVGELREQLLVCRQGQRLVYATDLADTPDNREALTELARGAHLLVCEAAFLQADRERAAATGHLTTRACAEIAAAAGVQWLVPFHLSSRYQQQVADMLAECRAIFPRTWPVLPDAP